eukprot:CAMPEP_0178483504 /NCGR_PEP_ID=MMETSP0696-20121128/7270_1 /TAXON_ID=265572 /ORGANISM="Extubocellulus spinifer, Strain CCMP396" /LENGTH=38 /DNA_ID= /DNA_START= /DNA_END= /DNA_ORIENTATION=
MGNKMYREVSAMVLVAVEKGWDYDFSFRLDGTHVPPQL